MEIPVQVPLIDIAGLRGCADSKLSVARAIGRACREVGFFYVSGHGISLDLQNKIEALSRDFFAQSHDIKMRIAMAKAGRAWRGFFPVGVELTSGLPDIKEGIYFGQELSDRHPAVIAGKPMHGANLFPAEPSDLRTVVLTYMDEMTALGHALMGALSLSLGLEENYFHERYTKDPLLLFRIFHYPVPDLSQQHQWGVGEHTDYGVLTILKQDACGGLEVKTKTGWTPAPPVENTFVCNIGDMLDRMTGGLYKSTPHRVRNASGRNRLSFPFFFDPGFESVVQPLPVVDRERVKDDSTERWDKANVHAFSGTYGQYLLSKVRKVFPEIPSDSR